MLDPRYPIGKFAPKEAYAMADVSRNIERIEKLPEEFAAVAIQLTPRQLDTPYREGGWTGRQVIHHVADSHLNAYIRTKWTLTENNPTIKAYNEKAWAETPEMSADPNLSLTLLRALHTRWVTLLKGMDLDQFSREFTHPETKKTVRLDRMVDLYAWHGEHHAGHLKILLR